VTWSSPSLAHRQRSAPSPLSPTVLEQYRSGCEESPYRKAVFSSRLTFPLTPAFPQNFLLPFFLSVLTWFLPPPDIPKFFSCRRDWWEGHRSPPLKTFFFSLFLSSFVVFLISPSLLCSFFLSFMCPLPQLVGLVCEGRVVMIFFLNP